MGLITPKHIAIILDGNRRFGEKVFGNKFLGHKYGADKIEEVLDWCKEFNIRTVTLWVFSTENFNRPREEVKVLMDLFEKKFKEIKTHPKIHKNKVKINFYGRLDLFPKRVQKAALEAMEATKDYNNYFLNLAMGYGGQQEILDIAKKLAKLVKVGVLDPEQINKKVIEENLYIVGLPEPDLIIRTGGMRRTSGFMPWHAAYAEWYISDKLWPEFERTDFIRALIDFSERKRNFGR